MIPEHKRTSSILGKSGQTLGKTLIIYIFLRQEAKANSQLNSKTDSDTKICKIFLGYSFSLSEKHYDF